MGAVGQRVGVQCYECGVITEYKREVTYDDPCPECLVAGSDDPYAVGIVVIEDCPADTPGKCESDDHHWGRHDHIIDDTERPERFKREAKQRALITELKQMSRELAT